MSGAEQDKPDQSEKKWFVFFVSRVVIVCFLLYALQLWQDICILM